MKKKSQGINEWWDLIYQTSFPKQDLISITEFIKEAKDSENYNAKILSGLDKLSLSEEGKLLVRSITDRIKLLIPLHGKKLIDFLTEVYPIIGIFEESEKQKKESLLNINKFHELAKRHSQQHYPELDSFLHHLNVMQDLGIEIEAAEIESSGVRVMTSHATKGLEFKTVILTNFAEKRFPIESKATYSLIPSEIIQSQKSIDSDLTTEEYEKHSQLLEERRLCYVSFTRAKENLYITYAKNYANKKTAPSQFLREIDYTQNDKIEFTKDKDEKYKIEVSEIAPASEEKNLTQTEKIKDKRLSPSSLLTFKECQKRFEYKYIYNMPEKITFSMEAAKTGSFIHEVLEKGVSQGFTSLKDFKDLALTLHAEEEWNSVDIQESLLLIKVFFERNKNKFSKNSKKEQSMTFEIDGIKFIGFADRIDFSPDGLEIIDYKTGKSPPSPLQRNFQLGYYALAASKLGKVKKITLDMLRNPVALEFEVDSTGLATSTSGRMSFNIYEIKEEITKTAKEILEAYNSGFKPCPAEKNCQFCEEYVY
ncbi:MAG: ATP-dependent helicase [Nanoarchaeota archaeon]|nr:ATP-dependent helicase [Nanoarchaeota archaeon]